MSLLMESYAVYIVYIVRIYEKAISSVIKGRFYFIRIYLSDSDATEVCF